MAVFRLSSNSTLHRHHAHVPGSRCEGDDSTKVMILDEQSVAHGRCLFFYFIFRLPNVSPAISQHPPTLTPLPPHQVCYSVEFAASDHDDQVLLLPYMTRCLPGEMEWQVVILLLVWGRRNTRITALLMSLLLLPFPSGDGYSPPKFLPPMQFLKALAPATAHQVHGKARKHEWGQMRSLAWFGC